MGLLKEPKASTQRRRDAKKIGFTQISVGHSEILLHLIAQNMSGNEAGGPLLGQKGA